MASRPVPSGARGAGSPPSASLSASQAVRTDTPRAARFRRGSQSAWGELLSDLNAHYRKYLSRRARSEAQVGAKTRRERRAVLELALKDLHCNGMELRKLKNLGAKHVRSIIAAWCGRGLLASTLATNISHLRTLCRWVGKPELIQVIDEIVASQPGLTRRRVATDRDRSEEGAGVDRGEVLAKAYEIDARFCCVLALIAEFGLRISEALTFRPHLAEDAAGCVRILWGTKGGRPRTLPLPLTPAQRAVLEWAKTFAETDAESMIPRGERLEVYRRRVYRLCAHVGLTKRQLGATPHSLRHGVLLRLYERLTGEAAPARGGTLGAHDAHADLAARVLVALQAGHSRPSVTSAYLGPRRVRRPGPTGSANQTTTLPSDAAESPSASPKPSTGEPPFPRNR